MTYSFERFEDGAESGELKISLLIWKREPLVIQVNWFKVPASDLKEERRRGYVNVGMSTYDLYKSGRSSCGLGDTWSLEEGVRLAWDRVVKIQFDEAVAANLGPEAFKRAEALAHDAKRYVWAALFQVDLGGKPEEKVYFGDLVREALGEPTPKKVDRLTIERGGASNLFFAYSPANNAVNDRYFRDGLPFVGISNYKVPAGRPGLYRDSPNYYPSEAACRAAVLRVYPEAFGSKTGVWEPTPTQIKAINDTYSTVHGYGHTWDSVKRDAEVLGYEITDFKPVNYEVAGFFLPTAKQIQVWSLSEGNLCNGSIRLHVKPTVKL